MARELDTARALARDAAALLRDHYERGTRTWLKGEDDPVGEADLASHELIASSLARAFPDDALLSEETDDDPARLGADRVWIVDPMDGTRAFADRVPEFSVSIALVVSGRPVVAAVHHAVGDVAVWAAQGGGTHRDGESVRVSACDRLSRAVLVASRSEARRGVLAAWQERVRELRPVSSIAWKLALVACGEADLNLSRRPKSEWDVCAGDLLVREAGGHYVDFSGRAPRYNCRRPELPEPMVAANATLLRELRVRPHDQ